MANVPRGTLKMNPPDYLLFSIAINFISQCFIAPSQSSGWKRKKNTLELLEYGHNKSLSLYRII